MMVLFVILFVPRGSQHQCVLARLRRTFVSLSKSFTSLITIAMPQAGVNLGQHGGALTVADVFRLPLPD